MSIIEKALDKLEKKKGDSTHSDDTARLDESTKIDAGYEAVEAKDSEIGFDIDDGQQLLADETPSSTTAYIDTIAVEKQERIAKQAASYKKKVSDNDTNNKTDKITTNDNTKHSESSQQASNFQALDLDKLSALGMVTPKTSNETLAEQCRMIKRPLLLNASAKGKYAIENGNLIMVTSALPAEGKTFISINLAMSIAMEMDRRVLLVDTDVDKASVSNVLGLNAKYGMTDYLLSNDMELSEVLIKTNVPKLTILPSGCGCANVTELLASGDMRKFMQELSQRYTDRIIMFDSPPLLVTSGSAVLAGLVGQIIMVVHAEKTLSNHVEEALKQTAQCKHVGLLLNRVCQGDRVGYKYGYGYEYASKRP